MPSPEPSEPPPQVLRPKDRDLDRKLLPECAPESEELSPMPMKPSHPVLPLPDVLEAILLSPSVNPEPVLEGSFPSVLEELGARSC